MEVLLVGGLVLAATLAIWGSSKNNKKIIFAWSSVATRRGFEFIRPALLKQAELHGRLNGRKLHVRAAPGDKNTPATTEFHLKFRRQLPVEMTLKLHTPFDKFLSLFGREDHLVGDVVFDDAVVVQSLAPKKLKAFLTPDRRQLIVDLFAQAYTVTIFRDQIEFSLRDIADTPEQLDRHLDLLDQVAEALEN